MSRWLRTSGVNTFSATTSLIVRRRLGRPLNLPEDETRLRLGVTDADYAAARSFWLRDISRTREKANGVDRPAMDSVWPRTADFRFDLENTICA
jgi:hypothetical protein